MAILDGSTTFCSAGYGTRIVTCRDASVGYRYIPDNSTRAKSSEQAKVVGRIGIDTDTADGMAVTFEDTLEWQHRGSDAGIVVLLAQNVIPLRITWIADIGRHLEIGIRIGFPCVDTISQLVELLRIVDDERIGL